MSIANFKKNLSDLNRIIYFDKNDYLREKSSDELMMKNVILEGEKLLGQSNNENDLFFLYGTLGNLYRIIGQPQRALTYLNSCLELAQKDGKIQKEVVTLIRIGEAWKYANEHLKALRTFDEAKDKCKDHEVYEDFILQHKGKCLMELGKLEEAEQCLLKALKLRNMKNDYSLINSTQKAIEYVNRMKTVILKDD